MDRDMEERPRKRPPQQAKPPQQKPKKKKMKKPKKSKLALISFIVAWLYALYLIGYFSDGVATTTGAEQAGAAIATALVMPHMVCVFIGAIFNTMGYFMNKHTFVLVGAILYAVSIALFPLYALFVVLPMVLSFVAYSKIKKQNQVRQRPPREYYDYDYEEEYYED